jgi:hypothetical protein
MLKLKTPSLSYNRKGTDVVSVGDESDQ